jgi:hypothetical protein
MVGASMPPIAPVVEATKDDASAEETVAVLFENGAFEETIVGREEPVERAGASTVTVPVTIEQKLDAVALLSTAAAVVWATWDSVTMALSPPAAALVATEATDDGVMVSVAMTLPGTVAVAVIGTRKNSGQC